MKKFLKIGCLSILGIIGAVVIIAIIVSVASQPSSEEVEELAAQREAALAEAQKLLDVCSATGGHGQRLSYESIFRDHPKYVGESDCFKGNIIQVIERGDDRFDFRINVTEGEYTWTDTVYASWEGKRFLDDDIVEFVGIVKGLKKYSAILGQGITIPEIEIHAMQQLPQPVSTR